MKKITFFKSACTLICLFLMGIGYAQENTATTCADGIDNDNDGLIDCYDDDCKELSDEACDICIESTTFADELIAYQSGCEYEDTDPEGALGVSDYDGSTSESPTFVALGEGGFIKLGFTNNILINSGDDIEDVWIFEVGPSVEASTIALRPQDDYTEMQLKELNIPDENEDGFYEIGAISGATSGVDIDNILTGYERGALKFDAIEITDKADSGCGGTTPGADIDAVCAISSIALSTQDFSKATVQIQPNPFSDVIKIKTNGSDNPIMSFDIYTINGQHLINKPVSFNQDINLKHLTPGVYYLRLSDGYHAVTKKLIKL